MKEKLEKQVESLGEEDPLEKEMATLTRILAWGIPCTEVHGVAKCWTRLIPPPPTHRYTLAAVQPLPPASADLPPTRPAPHHQFLLGHQPSNPVSALGGLLADPGQLPSVLNNGALKTLAATRETPPVGTRPLATSSAAHPWPRVGARNFPGGETTIRREPAWSPGWGDGGGRPPQAASGSGPCPGLTLAGGNRLRVRRFRMKP